jgi:hypothetical protein
MPRVSNGVAHSKARLSSVGFPIRVAKAKWHTSEGDIVREQDVVMCEADHWPEMIAENASLATWAVLVFGSTIVAISPTRKPSGPTLLALATLASTN